MLPPLCPSASDTLVILKRLFGVHLSILSPATYGSILRPCCTDRTVARMTPKTYGAEEARTLLPELLERAHRGASTIITKRGKPYALLVPVRETAGHRIPLMSLKGTGRGLWGAKPADSVAKLRDEWE